MNEDWTTVINYRPLQEQNVTFKARKLVFVFVFHIIGSSGIFSSNNKLHWRFSTLVTLQKPTEVKPDVSNLRFDTFWWRLRLNPRHFGGQLSICRLSLGYLDICRHTFVNLSTSRVNPMVFRINFVLNLNLNLVEFRRRLLKLFSDW